MEELIIRRFTTNDASEVTRMLGGLAEYHGEHAVCVPKDFLAHCLGPRRLADCWVVAAPDGLCGFVVTYDRFNFAQALIVRTVDLLYVDAPYRRQGLGARLLGVVAREGVARGVNRLTIGSMPKNQAAQRFYRKLGLKRQTQTSLRWVADPKRLQELSKV